MTQKFRAWDKASHAWRHDIYIGLDGLAKDLSQTGEEPFELPLDDVIIMQSTGLFDKNGKEIFEGDVVEVFDSRYTVFYDSENASFRLKPRDKRWNTDYMSNYAHEASFEIIGNIYENPELVEEK
ncbi:TPA: hypothetical protein TXJ05_000177 [Streptococcus suis]|nr:hypothetical protein [Streptococcus suis]